MWEVFSWTVVVVYADIGVNSWNHPKAHLRPILNSYDKFQLHSSIWRRVMRWTNWRKKNIPRNYIFSAVRGYNEAKMSKPQKVYTGLILDQHTILSSIWRGVMRGENSKKKKNWPKNTFWGYKKEQWVWKVKTLKRNIFDPYSVCMPNFNLVVQLRVIHENNSPFLRSEKGKS